MGIAEALQARGQECVGQRADQGHGDRPPIRALERADGLQAVAHRGQQRLGVGQEGAPGLGELRAPARAVEERPSQLTLQQVEPATHRRLREVQGGRGAREAAAADDRDERLDLVELHGSSA